MSISLTSSDLQRLQAAQRLLLSPPESGPISEWVSSVCEAMRHLFATDHVYYLEPDGLLVRPSLEDARNGRIESGGDASPSASSEAPTLFVRAEAAGEPFEQGIQRHFQGFEDGFSQFQEAYPTLQHRIIRAAGACAVHDAPLHDMVLREQLNIYQEVFRDPRIDRQMALSVPLPQGESMLIAGYENSRAAPFNGKRHQMLKLLVPAFEAGIRFRQRIAGAEQRVVEMIDAVETALLLFDQRGRLVHCSQAFARLCRRNALSEEDVRTLYTTAQALVQDARDPAADAPLMCARTVALRSGAYVLRLTKLDRATTGTLVSVERDAPFASAHTIQQHVGLTPRQSEVALLMAEGYTDAEIADRLFISVNTVHRHVARVLEKLDVSSRSAVALALLKAV
jgi:DNA-binding CsgD family transcriptional regulator